MQQKKKPDFLTPQDPDLEERLRSAIFNRTETGVPIIELKEHFRSFKNIIDFITSPEGMDMPSLWDFTRQYEKIRDFYLLACPWCNAAGPNPSAPFDCWGKSATQLQEDILFEKDENGVYTCPQCRRKQREMGIPLPNTMLGLVGMRGGKTMMAAQIVLWELHEDLLLPNPQKTWGLAPNQQVYYTCCTTKGEQATDTIFAAVDGIHDHSPWFKRYNEALRERAKEEKIQFDRVYTKSLSEIRYYHKQLFVDNTGANSAGIAGKTRKLVVMDEIARFVQTESRMGVDAVYDTLHQSLLTLSDHGSKMLNISSTQFKTDKIMMLYDAEQKNPSPRTLIFKYPTWEFNPKWPHNHPFFEDMRRSNPLALRRDFGCDPPGAQDPWMAEEWRIDECVDGNIPALIHVQDYTTSLQVQGKQTDMVSKKILYKDLMATKRIVISCDPGHRHDSFGMILAYIKPIRTVHGVQDHMFIGYAMAWEPTLNPRREVDFKNVLDLIKEFAAHWIVTKVVYDQWQSIFQIQDLKAAGIDAERISLKKEDWDSLASLFYNHQIHLLHDKIGGKGSERLVFELKNLQLTPAGKVDHQVNTTSDIAVCLARAAKILMGPEAEQQKIWDIRAKHLGRAVHFGRP